jgi:catechol 2,3-dioxygenase-like lactoylglutathione lyase family enzyme
VLDHLGIAVADYAKSKLFFQRALAPLGYELVMEFGGEAAGLGVGGRPDFWIAKSTGTTSGPAHICFAAESRAVVDAFHKAALAAGGTDNGAPGLRPQYHPTYYGAFVLDPDGNNVEAVCHAPA